MTCIWGWGGVISHRWCSQCQRVMLFSGSRNLMEEIPGLYLLEEASAGGLKRPCAPKMGSDLAPGRMVIELSCPCASPAPALSLLLLQTLYSHH